MTETVWLAIIAGIFAAIQALIARAQIRKLEEVRAVQKETAVVVVETLDKNATAVAETVKEAAVVAVQTAKEAGAVATKTGEVLQVVHTLVNQQLSDLKAKEQRAVDANAQLVGILHGAGVRVPPSLVLPKNNP